MIATADREIPAVPGPSGTDETVECPCYRWALLPRPGVPDPPSSGPTASLQVSTIAGSCSLLAALLQPATCYGYIPWAVVAFPAYFLPFAMLSAVPRRGRQVILRWPLPGRSREERASVHPLGPVRLGLLQSAAQPASVPGSAAVPDCGVPDPVGTSLGRDRSYGARSRHGGRTSHGVGAERQPERPRAGGRAARLHRAHLRADPRRFALPPAGLGRPGADSDRNGSNRIPWGLGGLLRRVDGISGFGAHPFRRGSATWAWHCSRFLRSSFSCLSRT